MKKLFFTLTCLVLFLVSCSDDTSGDLSQTSPTSQKKDKQEVTIVFDGTNNLDQSILNVEENRIVFEKKSQINLEGKEYLAAGQLSVAPNGFLRKIVSVVEQGDRIIVETELAEITDLMPEGDLQTIYNYDNMDLKRSLVTDKGDEVVYSTETSRGANLGTFKVSLNRVVFDADGNLATTYDQISARGTYTVQPSLDFGVRFRWGNLQDFRAVVTSKKTVDLDLYWSYTHNLFSHSIPIAKIPLPPVTFMVGWAPVVITNSIDISIDAKGSVNASISTGVKGSVTLKEGLKYNRRRGWNFTHEAYNLDFSFKPVSATFGFNASLALSEKFDTSFYGVLGVSIGPEAGFYVNGKYYADTDQLNYIDWFAGFRAGMNAYARAGLFGIPGLNFSWGYPIWNKSWPITQGQIIL